MQGVGALAAKVSRDQVQQFLEIRVKRRVPCLLNPKFNPHHHRVCSQDHVDSAIDVGAIYARMLDPFVNRNVKQYLVDFFEVMGMSVDEGAILTAASQNQ